jgi:hypothetical protein
MDLHCLLLFCFLTSWGRSYKRPGENKTHIYKKKSNTKKKTGVHKWLGHRVSFFFVCLIKYRLRFHKLIHMWFIIRIKSFEVFKTKLCMQKGALPQSPFLLLFACTFPRLIWHSNRAKKNSFMSWFISDWSWTIFIQYI